MQDRGSNTAVLLPRSPGMHIGAISAGIKLAAYDVIDACAAAEEGKRLIAAPDDGKPDMHYGAIINNLT